MNRYAGVLMSVTSLPSPYGIGCFDGAAYAFVDWLAKAGQRYWQILPLGATAYGLPDNSPYQAYSAFAGSPYLISLETLIGEGVLTREECDAVDFGSDPAKIDFDKLHENRLALLHKAYERSNIAQDGGFHAFCADNAWWLDDYALFMALKTFFREAPFQSWPKDIRMHWDFAVDYYNRELYFDVEFHKYLQYKFAQQWSQLKAYAANARAGHWEKGPGMELFDTMHWQLGEVNVIAEDLGLLTDSVRALVRASGCPNMKVLQFAIDPEDTTASNDYWPHNYNTHCVVYTGTHDNPTLAGWYAGLDEASRRQVRDYLGDAFTPDAQMYKVLIRLALRSVAKDCIIPIQDYLGLGNEARMNQPGTVGFNWRWRLAPGQVTDALADELMALTTRTGRVNWDILNG